MPRIQSKKALESERIIAGFPCRFDEGFRQIIEILPLSLKKRGLVAFP